MKAQRTEDMVQHIRAILEENQSPEYLRATGDVKTLSLETLIANSLEQAVAMTVTLADEGLFENIDTQDYTKGTFDLSVIETPENMLRILSITSEDWNGVVKEILNESSPLYRMCNNKYVNSIGVKDRPMAFKRWKSSSKTRHIKLFPVPDNVTVYYIEKPVIGTTTETSFDDESGKSSTTTYASIPCDDQIYEGACWYCAYLVASVQGWQNAEYYRNEAIKSLQMITPMNDSYQSQQS